MPLTPSREPHVSDDSVLDFGRAAACQMTNDPGKNMTMNRYSDEQEHMYNAIHACLEAAEPKMVLEGLDLLQRFANEEDVEIFVDAHQLEKTGNTHEARNHWYRSGAEWCSPVGDGYTLLQPKQQNKTVVVRSADLVICFGQVAQKEIVIPDDTPPRTTCLKMKVCDQMIQLADKKLMKPFELCNWRPPPDPQDDVADMPTNDVSVNLAMYAVKQATSAGMGTQLMHCILVPPRRKDDEPTHQALCNFYIDKIDNFYKYISGSKAPWYRIRVGRTVNFVGEKDYTLVGNERPPADARHVYRTLLFQMSDFRDKGMITTFASLLGPEYMVTNDKFSSTCFLNIISQMPHPPCQYVVSNFGRQPDSRVMFFANCTYEDGIVRPHEGSSYSLISDVFNDIDAPTRIDPANYPELCIIPQHHVRWFILCRMWHNTLPEVFKDNVDAAKNAFSACIAHLFYGELIKNGLNNAVPVPILYSPEGHTGKTYVLKLINAFMGWKPTLKIGAMNTAPAISYSMSHLQADLTYTMDELVMRRTARLDNPKLKNIIHLSFQAGARAVCGKDTEQCRSQLCATTNIIPNVDDGAFQSRLLIFNFVKVTDKLDSDAKKQFNCLMDIVSALQPDLEQLRHDGEVDMDAIQDCALFLEQAACTNNSRSTSMWAYVLYYRLMIEWLTLSNSEHLGAVLCSVTEQAIGAHNDTSLVNNVLSEFLVKLEDTRNISNPLNPHASEVIYLHNFRDTLAPPTFPDVWYCLRLKLVLGVVNRLNPECHFTKSEIVRSIRQKQYHQDFIIGKAEFYDLNKGWPMKNPLNVMEVLTEDDDFTTISDDALFIRKSVYLRMIAEKQVGSAASEARLSQIHIESYKDGETYNFYETVTKTPWWGFRAILNTDFRSICGGDNALMNDSNPVQSIDYRRFGMWHKEQDWPKLSECLTFDYMRKKYNTTFTPGNLPPCLKYDCFLYRNDKGDRYQPDDDSTFRPISPDQASELPSGDNGGISRPQSHSCIRTTSSSNPDDGELSMEDAVEDARGENLMDSDGESEVSSFNTDTHTDTHTHPALFLLTVHVRELHRPRLHRRRRRNQPHRGRAPHRARGLRTAERGRRRLRGPDPGDVPVSAVRRAGP